MLEPWMTCLALALVAGPPRPEPPARPAVVLTTDLGAEVDDQWALVHLALSTEFDLRGVVTTHSPALPEPAAEGSAAQVRAWLDRLPPGPRPPVLAGSSRPLAAGREPRDNPGVRFLLDQARNHDAANRLVVVVIGAATDVASALRVDPTWADRVRVVAMGFDEWGKGGDVWNVKNDVEAWRTLLDSRTPIVVGDSAVTRRALQMTPDRASTLLAYLPEPAPALRTALRDWLARSGPLAERETGSAAAWPIWDEVAAAVLLGMATVEDRPRPRLGADLRFDRTGPPSGTIGWVTAIDAEKLWADLARKIRAGRDRAGSVDGARRGD